MKKYILILFLISCKIYAYDLNKYNVLTNLLVANNHDKELKEPNYRKYLSTKISELSINMGINQNKLKNKTYYLTIVSDLKSLRYLNQNYIIHGHMLVIKLDKYTPKNIIFKYKYEKEKIAQFRFNVISAFEYNYILPYEGILYGLAYGIIFCAFLYYIIIYFSTFRRFFLYYSIMQFFVLLSLIGFVYCSFVPYPNIHFSFVQPLIDTFETSGFLFTLLFAKEILDTRNKIKLINKVLNFFILLNVLDLIAIWIFKYSILYEYMPFYVGFLVPVLSGVIAVYKGNKSAVFYTIGWFFVFACVFSYEHDLIPLSGIYTIHIAAPMESLIFSFALGYMLRNLVKEQNEKEKLLIHKSKLASMGEMIDNIAHQWRQPLTHLGYINMNLEMSSINNNFEKDYFIKKLKESNKQIKFMSNTIDDFRDFYKIDKQKEEFLVSNACNLAINIIKQSLEKKNIKFTLDLKNDTKIIGYKNEYAQVVLNFFTNSMEIFEQKKVENPYINLIIDNKNNKSIIKVCDNAKGIDSSHMKQIFNPHFTTKKRGSGIGLYMSQMIIQSHFNGDISVENTNDGVCFKVCV